MEYAHRILIAVDAANHVNNKTDNLQLSKQLRRFALFM